MGQVFWLGIVIQLSFFYNSVGESMCKQIVGVGMDKSFLTGLGMGTYEGDCAIVGVGMDKSFLTGMGMGIYMKMFVLSVFLSFHQLVHLRQVKPALYLYCWYMYMVHLFQIDNVM